MTNSWHYDCDNNKRMIIYARSNEGVKAAPQTLYRMVSYDYVKLLTQTLLQRTKIKVEEAVFTRIKLPKLVHCVVGCWASITEAELQHINILDTDTKWKFITTSAKTFAIHYLGPRPMMSKLQYIHCMEMESAYQFIVIYLCRMHYVLSRKSSLNHNPQRKLRG